MTDLNMFLATVKSKNGADVSLRRVFPGRGSLPTKRRAEVKAAFNHTDTLDGVFFDRKRGVFVAVAQPVESA